MPKLPKSRLYHAIAAAKALLRYYNRYIVRYIKDHKMAARSLHSTVRALKS
jgi:hypothetical protein